jgi:hypothetical protein
LSWAWCDTPSRGLGMSNSASGVTFLMEQRRWMPAGIEKMLARLINRR